MRAVTGPVRCRSRPMPRSAGPLLCLLVVLCAGCRDVTRVLRLTNGLHHEFAATRMGVSLTDGLILTVTVVDSVLVTAPCQTQVAVAMRVGRFLQQHDAELESVQVINVAFAPGRTDAAVPAHSAHLPIRFSRATVAGGLGTSDSTEAVGSCKAYEELN